MQSTHDPPARNGDDTVTVTITIPRSALASVLAQIGAVAPEPEPEVYGSRPPYSPPPGRSHRWMREHGRELLAYGATRTGGRRGRSVLWTISRADWLRYVEATRRTEPMPSPTTTQLPRIDPERWLRESGHRLTRRSA